MLTSDFRRVSDFREHARILGFDEQSILPLHKQYQAVFVPKLAYGEMLDDPTILRPEFHSWLMQRYIFENPRSTRIFESWDLP